MTGTPAGTGSVTQLTILRAEWIKLRSLRSTWWSLGLMLVFTAGLGWLFGFTRAHDFHKTINDPNHGGLYFIPDPATISLNGIMLAQLVIGVLGVLVVTGEYSTRQVLSTMSSVPHRLPVLVGKSLTFAVVGGIVAEAATVLAFTFGQAALASTHQQAHWSSVGATRAVFGGGLYLVLIGLLGTGLGFIVRNTAAAISLLMALVLVLPLLVAVLPSPYNQDIQKFLPLTAGTQIIATPFKNPDWLSPWAGLGVMAIWSAVALVVGAIVLQKRDC